MPPSSPESDPEQKGTGGFSGSWPPRGAVFFTPPLDPAPHAEALRAELQSAMTALEEVLAKDFRIGPAR